MKRADSCDLPLALAGTPLAGQFRYWSGASGKRYLHKILPIELAPDFRHCALLLVSVRGDGEAEVVWAGAAGAGAAQAIAAARAAGASEAHVHLLTETPEDAKAVANDIRSAIEGETGHVAAA
ncbi:hypothetical protein [Lutibaculum baratangense]|uniref:Uncharacterized protein n=1 Tax=Lutibaculum baratangense AMV1 TaxID=631454 RepID=V4RTK1_9HYPH|nr:hypothetical protein [Lutibaculum baratangense]ESR26405.1 hypothetical protein N177_0905 [Lutibaculum baratangense AMV1]